MTVQAILLPVFVQVALTFFLGLWMARRRTGAVMSREVHPKDMALGQNVWPPRVQQISNAFHNQLEMPILFYVLVVLAMITHKADLVFVVLSWAFVASRLVHAAIHVGSNRVPRRGLAFAVGVVVLIVMWLIFAVRILTGF